MSGKKVRQKIGPPRSGIASGTIFPIAFGVFFWLSNSFFGARSLLSLPSVRHASLLSPLARNVRGETILALNDLPAGFEVAPPLLQQMVSRAIGRSRADLEKANISVRETAIFVNMEEAEMVACVTIDLPDRTARTSFDRRLQRGDGREVFESGFRQVLGWLGEPKIEEPRAIASLESLGEFARGYHLAATVENFPVRVFADSLAFRRGGTGVVMIVGSVGQIPERVQVRDLALALDRRLQNVSALGGRESRVILPSNR